MFLFYLAFLFVVVFPKGGVKIAGIPITWGYVILGVSALFLILRKEKIKIETSRLNKLIAFIPLQILFIYKLVMFGQDNLGFTISFITSFFFLPFCFYVLFAKSIDNFDLEFFKKFLKESLFFLSCYGIFLFFYKIAYGSFIEIPMLTINLHDAGTLETTKCIDRGNGIFKLISTYNNGNLFGVCCLMWLPLYYLAEKSEVKKLIFRLALLLTLSRTVWYGAIFAEILYYLYTCKIEKRMWMKLGLILSFYFSSIFFITQFLNRYENFLTDTSLGGRSQQLLILKNFSLMPSKSFFGILEMVYLGVLDEFGLVGIIAFLIAMLAPIFINKNGNRALLSGLMIYLFVAISDGTILLIPTMAIYLFLASLLSRPPLPSYVASPLQG
jgi:hypothetical protein